MCPCLRWDAARSRYFPWGTRCSTATSRPARGRSLHHVALKVRDIDATLGALAAAGLRLIDTRGRPGSRRARIGFVHPAALGGILMHLVQRDG